MEKPQLAPEERAPEKKVTKKRGKGLPMVVGLILLIALLGGAYLLLKNASTKEAKTDNSVLVTVNGTEITKQQVNNRVERNRASLEAQGNDLSDSDALAFVEEQLLTQLVNEALVLEAARSAGIVAAEADIEREYATIQSRFETPELFSIELENNRFTEETLRENIERELLIQAYLNQNASAETIEVTEEEIVALYEAAEEQGQELPPLEEVRDQAETQIRNQKLALSINAIVENLRANATIVFTNGEAEEGEE